MNRVAIAMSVVLGCFVSFSINAAGPVPEDGKALLMGTDSSKMRVLFRTLDDGPVLLVSRAGLGTTLSVAPGSHKVNVMCEFKGNGYTQLVPGNVVIDAEVGHTYDVSGVLDADGRTCTVKASSRS